MRAAASAIAATEKVAASSLSAGSGFLQRKCACRSSNMPLSDMCEDCQTKRLQRKLLVGASNDPLEIEADRVADQVMAIPAHPVVNVTPPRIQRFSGHSNGQIDTAAPASVDRVLAGPGKPLEPALRQDMEQRFGHDFASVRVHTDAVAGKSARDVNANAYTVGNDIVFGAGSYIPGTYYGRFLIAHELTHVLQQVDRDMGDPARGAWLQRNGAGLVPTQAQSGIHAPSTRFQPARASGTGQVQQILISCADKLLRLETTSGVFVYQLINCSIPIGSYNPSVSVDDNYFVLDFDVSTTGPRGQIFHFTYAIEPGQLNPAILFGEQASVLVDVVEHVSGSTGRFKRERILEHGARCLVRAPDRELVPLASTSRALFNPKKFKRTLWSHEIPLGMFGWVEVSAKAFGDLSGSFAAGYGPGRLSDICLTYLAENDAGGDPLDPDGPTNFRVGGRAKFTLPARTVVRVVAHGGLRIDGAYLSTIDVAAAEGVLTANGSASFEGSVDAEVDIAARATRPPLDPRHPVRSISALLAKCTIDGIDLTAKVGLHGRAGLEFKVDLSAGFEILGHSLWRESWKLPPFRPSVSWSGGIVYSPNPGPYWDLGGLGNGIDASEADIDAGESNEHWLDSVDGDVNSAKVDADDVVSSLFEEKRAKVQIPDGLSESNALPFEWRKPKTDNFYPEKVEIPNADNPKELDRDRGPSRVDFKTLGKDDRVKLGVADWPDVGKTFQYTPYSVRKTPEQERFNRLLDRLGYVRSGVDAEHVWDVGLLGLEYDRFDNLWPASNQEQQLAGGQHDRQIANYRSTMTDPRLPVEGRHFVIIRVRHPALGE